ncbi:MAG: DUF2752 domain-containing protein [Ruminococcus sp.]|nr:DUF2752 domain-containing protein [Ruminococcus sp.]
MKLRIKKLTLAAVILIAAGLFYLAVNKLTGFAIPCVFHLVTGLYCPGCGVTGMIISLLHFDFLGAFKHNVAIITALPALLYLFIAALVRYIKTGQTTLTRFQNILLYILIGYFIVFAVLRNIPYFDFLAPY